MLIIVQVYVVYLGSLPKGEFSPMSQHLGVLEDVLEGRYFFEALEFHIIIIA